MFIIFNIIRSTLTTVHTRTMVCKRSLPRSQVEIEPNLKDVEHSTFTESLVFTFYSHFEFYKIHCVHLYQHYVEFVSTGLSCNPFAPAFSAVEGLCQLRVTTGFNEGLYLFHLCCQKAYKTLILNELLYHSLINFLFCIYNF